jgi:hypothetical protein
MRILILASILALAAAHARADGVRDALADIVKCADLADPSKRLACFDAATARGRGALAAPAQTVREKGGGAEDFGLQKSQPVVKAEDFGKAAPEPGPKEITQISATVVEFAKTQRGRAIFVLDNGQIWRQLDSDGTELPYPSPGTTMKVTIEKGWVNSYNLMIAGRNGLIKVSRMK